MSHKIQVSVNNESSSFDEGCTVDQLLHLAGFVSDEVAVAINMEFVPRSQFAQTVVQANDEIDVLTAVQGG